MMDRMNAEDPDKVLDELEAKRKVCQRTDKQTSFGPCAQCEYPITHSLCGPSEDLKALCDLCRDRHLAKGGMLRQPEHFVI